jgi:hypothetical protein
MSRVLSIVIASVGLMVCSTAAPAANVFFSDFAGSMPSEITGAGSLESVQGYQGVGNAPNIFDGRFLRNASTGNPAAATILTLSNLPAHTELSLGLLLGIIDSWDGLGSYGPDYFNIELDNAVIFSEAFQVAAGPQTYVPPPGGWLVNNQALGWGNAYPEDGYDLYLEPRLQSIPHTAPSAVIRFFASGGGWQGGTDESWAIENLQVSVIPEPGAFALLACAVLATLSPRRR